MYVIPLTRIKEGFPVFHQTLSSSATNTADTASHSASASEYTSIESGMSVSVSDFEGYQTFRETATNFTYEGESRGRAGATTSANATLTQITAFNSSSSSYSSSEVFGTGTDSTFFTTTASNSLSLTTDFSSSALVSEIFATTTSTDSTSTVYTSTNTDTTLTKYTVSDGSLTTESYIGTVIAGSSYTTDTTSLCYTSSFAELSTYIEVGDAMFTERTDWLWTVTGSTIAPHFVFDMASTISGTTIWPDSFNRPIVFTTAASDASTMSFSFPDITTSYGYEFMDYSTSETVTITTGHSLARTTTTTEVPKWEVSTNSVTAGIVGTSFFAPITESYSITVSLFDTLSSTVLYAVGYSNLSTTGLQVVSSYLTTSTAASGGHAYTPSYEITADSGTTVFGATVEGTDVFSRGTILIPFGDTANGITPIAPYGAFVAPHNLRSTGNHFAFASNLSFAGGIIPFDWFNSVGSNAAVPSPFSYSLSSTNSHTWFFSWSDDTLKITEQSTFTSGTKILTHSTLTSGTFSNMGSESTYYIGGGSVFGGFNYIDTAAETVLFPQRAVIGTSISLNGSSETYRSLVTVTESTVISETVFVEQAVPAYGVFTNSDGYAGSALLVFARN